jgi:hypothetical protein
MADPLSYREQNVAALRQMLGENTFLLRFALFYSVECLGLDQLGRLVDAVSECAENPDFKRLTRARAVEEERLRPSRLS